MQANTTTPAAATVYELPPVEQLQSLMSKAKTVDQQIAVLHLIEAHMELISQEISELPTKTAGEVTYTD